MSAIKIPKPASGDKGPIQTVESLQEHLQFAMAVELSTIPLYLYGMYSVNNDNAVSGAVRGVVVEEMLHLCLAGNALLAVGGTPKLYDPEIIPKYPAPMPGRKPDLILQLREMTKENLQTYIDSAPLTKYAPQLELPEAADAPAQPDEYNTLGQFYLAIEQGFQFLSSNPNLFNLATIPAQFPPDSVFFPKFEDEGGIVVVQDLPSALTALTTIVHQGEGNPRPFVGPDKDEKDHYDIFLDLQSGGQTWNTFPVALNPTSDQYLTQNTQIYAVSRTVDASFCYLLLTLEKLWTISSPDVRDNIIGGNFFQLMTGILGPLSGFLVQQQISPTSKEVAGPCFGYYKFDPPASALQKLKQEIQSAITAYAGNPNALATLQGVQQTINGLVDIATV
ncbi:hypothetical protein PILCRDRAFT_85939 [Piloderma croceum F 1598]|uniref:Iminophenyl-pyruvate dimer synthase domain-containing protein n=1 Tax=Piloderma croceum (strain F 1598) TaxID=765440 RepID=A0A0C3G6T8_PILCF|nr:hypothetical protein PILCRDRAFT_85939 [Piloderma croceum F 1598]